MQKKKAPRYYQGPIVFKDNFNGIGFIAAPNEVQRLRDGTVKDNKEKNRISMSEFNYAGGIDEEDDENDLTGAATQMTKVYDDRHGDKSMYNQHVTDTAQSMQKKGGLLQEEAA